MTRASIADIVLGIPNPERPRHRLIALFATLAVHSSVCIGAHQFEPKRIRAPVAPMRIEIDLAPVAPVDPRVSPPQPLNPPQPSAAPTRPKPANPERRRAEPQPPPEPAPAAGIVASEATPVDLTDQGFVVGSAQTFAGGVTAAQGDSDQALRTEPESPPSPAIDHSSTVSLESQNWSCPWPAEAESAIAEQTVVIRVRVDASGRTESAAILVDPGHGFGPAAISCAMHTHFTPARDREGNPVRASSPPIRIRFTR